MSTWLAHQPTSNNFCFLLIVGHLWFEYWSECHGNWIDVFDCVRHTHPVNTAFGIGLLHACKLSSLLFWWGTRLIIHELLMETVFDTLWDQSATMEASELYLFKINSWRQKNPNQILNKPMQLYRLLLNNKLLILYRKSWSFNYRSLCYGGRCHCLTMCMGDKMSAADISVADADILRRRQHGLYTKQ